MGKGLAATVLSTIIIASLLAIPTASGDDSPHLFPVNLQIHSETVLSGVDIYDSNIGNVIRNLGKSGHSTISRTNELTKATVFTNRAYEWQTKNRRLRIRVYDDFDSSKITQVDVWGTHADNGVGVSGHGLKLGDTIDDAWQVYGLRSYVGATIPADSLPWARCEPTLVIDFDKNRKVNHMALGMSCKPSY